MVMKLATEYPVSLVCQTLGYPRSSYYYQTRGRDDQVLKKVLEQVAGTWPTYGYRRLTAQLQREGWPVNEKRVRRIMREMGLQGKVYRKKRRTLQTRIGELERLIGRLTLELEIAKKASAMLNGSRSKSERWS